MPRLTCEACSPVVQCTTAHATQATPPGSATEVGTGFGVARVAVTVVEASLFVQGSVHPVDLVVRWPQLAGRTARRC